MAIFKPSPDRIRRAVDRYFPVPTKLRRRRPVEPPAPLFVRLFLLAVLAGFLLLLGLIVYGLAGSGIESPPRW